MKKILVVVDMQNDFVSGSLGSPQARKIVPNVVEKIKNADEDTFIICTQDTHDGNYLETMEGKNLPVKHCIRGEVGRGWDIIDEIYEPFCGKIHQWLCKDTFGYLYWEDSLSSEIIGGLVSGKIEEIEIIGLCTDVCVVSNALILKSCFSETRIVVDASCCTGVTEEGHKAALLTMKSCQIQIINE